VLQRTMREWNKAGGGRKAISMLHGGMSHLWHGWNSIWKTFVLLPRLPGALPLRIGTEQQVRMPAAADAASMVYHPIDWWKSTTAGTKMFPDSDYALLGASPAHALGTTIDAYDQNANLRLIHMGRESVTIGDTANRAAFFRGYAGRLKKWSASPEVRDWHLPHLGSPETTITTMRESPMGQHFLGLYAKRQVDEVEAVTRTQTELQQLIGTGPGADLVRVALRQGRVKIDGEVLTIGSEEFAAALGKMFDDGRWVPGTGEVRVSEGVYLPPERLAAAREVRDIIFHYGYAVLDLAASRSPLWRQLGAREYRNLIRLGYSPERALNMAYASAARRTADVMFNIGANSPGDYFLRNINPFFPAYRELAETWLLRVPMRIGAGAWPLGAAALARRADIWMDFFKQMGVVKTNDENQNYITAPFIAPLVRLFGGGAATEEGLEVTSLLDSLAGLFPAPTNLFGRDEQGNPLPLHERLEGVFPTLGQPATYTLGRLNDLANGKLDTLVDFLTLTGTDSSLGPRQVDLAYESTGAMPPWVVGQTRNAHQAQINSSIMDGMRIAMNQGEPPPEAGDFDTNNDGDLSADEQRAFRKAGMAWAEGVIHKGQSYSTAAYLTRAVTGMLLPFNVQFQDEDKAKFDRLWSFIDVLPEEIQSPYIEAILSANPDLDTYMNGKTIDLRRVDDPNETMDEFFEAVRKGDIRFRTPEEYAVFSWGMRSYGVYLSRVDAIYENAGDTPAEQMLNFEAKEAVEREREEWEDFLAVTSIVDNYLLQQEQSFMTMLNTVQGYREIRDKGAGRMRPSLEQEQLVKFDRIQKEYAKYFSVNQESSDEYFKLKEAAYALMGNGPTTALGMANEWYFGQVADAYYDKRNKLYDSLDGLNDDEKAPVYQQIRDLANKYNGVYVNRDHPEWGEFPSPEEYTFAGLNENEQEQEVTNWASLPATFLTQFQREQVGYAIEDQGAANTLANYVTRNEIKFDKQTDRYDINPGTEAYDINRQTFDKAYVKKAEELGLGQYWKQSNAPIYTRIGRALNLNDRTATWGLAVKAAERTMQEIENTKSPSTGQFYSAKGDSDVAKTQRAQFANLIRRWKENDPAFREVMDNLSVSLADEGQVLGDEDLVDILFFDVFQF